MKSTKDSLSKAELAALNSLAKATGLSNRALAEKLDADEITVWRWLSGERKPRHPAMLRRALQLIVLEQKGVITDKLIENATK
jgi:DNA-binding transcriptional regulator YiaG